MKKNLLLYFIAVLLTPLFLTSCEKQGLTVDRSSIYFEYFGGTQVINVETDWSYYPSIDLSGTEETTNPFYAYQANNSLYVVAEENKSKNPISAMLELYSYDGKGDGGPLASVYLEIAGNPYADSGDEPGGNTGGGNSGGPLSAPDEVKVTVNDPYIVVSWNPVENATGYEVWRSVGSSSGTYSLIATTANTSYTDSPERGWNYYKIKATNSNYTSGFSEMTGGMSSGTDPEPDNTKPATPKNVKAKQSGNSITVSWNEVSNASYYQFWYKKPYPYDIESFDNVYDNEVTIDQPIEGTWTFWVVAVDKNYNMSDPSSKVTCNYKDNSGGGNNGGDDGGKTQLDTPTNLEASSGYNYVQISFDEVPLAYEYYLYRSTRASSGYTKVSASGGSTSGGRYVLTDSNPQSGTTYYKVKAIALSYLGIKDSEYSSYVKVER